LRGNQVDLKFEISDFRKRGVDVMDEMDAMDSVDSVDIVDMVDGVAGSMIKVQLV
jgi:hypothetical protein